MEFKEFVKEYKRMCREHRECTNCEFNTVTTLSCSSYALEYPDEAEKIVERWAKEHPVKTRQSELLKLFPDVLMKGKYVDICPAILGEDYKCDVYQDCGVCKKAFWSVEINEYKDEIKETREEYKIKESEK